jgi:hypothetical protein
MLSSFIDVLNRAVCRVARNLFDVEVLGSVRLASGETVVRRWCSFCESESK